MTQTPKYTFVSARMAHNLSSWALGQGLKSEHSEAFSAKVLKAMAKEIESSARKAIEVEKNDGGISRKECKEHDVKQRASGKLLKLSNGTKHEWYIETAHPAVKALVRQDQALAGLEALGAGAVLIPVRASAVETYLLKHLEEFKASRPAEYTTKSEETMKREESALNGQ